MQNYSAELAHFAANLSAQAIPASVMNRAEDLLVDWFGSAIAGKVLSR
jgi:2-methylcitrate dehydratase PrpD